MEKRIAILLNGEIRNDYRVIKIIQTVSKKYLVDLYYLNGNKENDNAIFNDRVTLRSYKHTPTLKVNLLRHSFFCFEFNFMFKAVVESGVEYDIIWSNDLPTLNPAFKISRKLGVKLVFDSHEIYTETINQFFPREIKGLKGRVFSFLINAMRQHGISIEKKIIPQVDLFITVNESLLEYFSSRYLIKKGIVVMNVPTSSKEDETQVIDYKSMFTWDINSKVLLYQGHLNEGRGLRLLPDTMKNLPFDYKLVILGDGPLKHDLLNLVDSYGLNERIKFLDAVPLKILPAYTRGADAGINLLESFNLSKQLASPNKLFEYIHYSLPIVASKTVENEKVFKRYNIGELTINDPIEIASAVEEILGQPNEKYKEALSLAKEYYNWAKQEKLLLSAL